MFTGIIEGLGTVVAVDAHEDSAVLTIDAGDIVADLGAGGSLAVNGVCLTSVIEDAGGSAEVGAGGSVGGEAGRSAGAGTFVAEVMGETLRLTGLGALSPGDPVNLERCTPAGGRLDGHIVQGHVDGLGTVLERTDHAEWTALRVGIPDHLAPLTAVKGSIALNGVSLTLTGVSAPPSSPAGTAAPGPRTGIAAPRPEADAAAPWPDVDREPAWVEVGLIPATLTHTTFGAIRPGASVNVEVDVIAKYTARLLSFGLPEAQTHAATSAHSDSVQSHPGGRDRSHHSDQHDRDLRSRP